MNSLAWPLAVVALVLFLRRPLSTLLISRPVKSFEAGPKGVKIEYIDAKIEDARNELEEARGERIDSGETEGTPSEDVVEQIGLDDFTSEMEQLASIAPRSAVLE